MTLDTYAPEFEKAVDFLRHELQAIRTGRASPALVEDILVDAYNAKMSVKQLATISVPDARTLQVDPWDKAVTKDIERAIRIAQPSLNPVSTGNSLRIPMPQLTEDARKELVKMLGKKVEEAKQRVRRVRDDARSAIIEAERAKELSEDDRYRLQKKLDEMSEEYNSKLKSLQEKKEVEVTTM
ncbi:MAG: ribosome recycling factor [Candidatus Uhrbacteria bacterium]